MNIFDDMKAEENRTECQHIWVWSEDKNSIYCYDCKIIKYIKPRIPFEDEGKRMQGEPNI